MERVTDNKTDNKKLFLVGIALVLSLVLNGIVLIGWVGAVITILTILFALSAWMNIYQWRGHRMVSSRIDELFDSMADFVDHIEQINAMEIYHGDETIFHLLMRSRSLAGEMADFEDFITGLGETSQEEDSEDEEEVEDVTPALLEEQVIGKAEKKEENG